MRAPPPKVGVVQLGPAPLLRIAHIALRGENQRPISEARNLAGGRNHLDTDVAIGQPSIRRGALELAARLAVEGNRPGDFARKVLGRRLELIEIADVALEGLPATGPLRKCDPNVGRRAAAIRASQPRCPFRRQVLQDADNDIFVGRDGGSRESRRQQQRDSGDTDPHAILPLRRLPCTARMRRSQHRAPRRRTWRHGFDTAHAPS